MHVLKAQLTKVISYKSATPPKHHKASLPGTQQLTIYNKAIQKYLLTFAPKQKKLYEISFCITITGKK